MTKSVDNALFWIYSVKQAFCLGLIKLFVKSLKREETMDLILFLGKFYIKSSLARHILEPILESWVNFFKPPLSTSQTLQKIKI